jgi:hypothetical protein
MNRHAEAILKSIMEELAASEKSREEVEAKAVFCLLNYCPQVDDDTRLIEKPSVPE